MSSTLRSELRALRGLWHGTEIDLQRLGISRLADLRGCDAAELAAAYCKMTTRPMDHALHAYFVALIGYARTGVPTPWWGIMRDEAIRDAARIMTTRGQPEGAG